MTEGRRRRRGAWLLVGVLATVAVGVVVVGVAVRAVGCCGPAVAYGELWYCVEPDAAHPAGDSYLLTTHQRDRQAAWLQREWPDRIETGHVGTPLQWLQPAGTVDLALNRDPTGPNDSAVDERQTAEVVEGRLTQVLVAADDATPAACPAPPSGMSASTP